MQKHVPELKDDRYAGEEVARQLASARQTLEKRIQHYAGLRQSSRAGEMPIRWYPTARRATSIQAPEFLALLSDLCNLLYGKAPKIHNELVNRRSLSSAAAMARMRLVERMFTFGDQEFLGMDRTKKPPEMSIYLSLLLEPKLHVQRDGKWTFQEPSAKADPCNLLPGLTRVRELLESKPDTRFPVSQVLEEL